MSYPFLPVNSCCTDVVINDPCGCSSTITTGGCNNNPCGTNVTLSSTIIYNGPALTCTTAEPCDTLNVILQKIDEIICNLLSQISTLNTQVTNINNQLVIINGDITDIYNTLDVCCNVTTTSTSSSTSTTTTSTTCNPSSTHPFIVSVISGTNTVPDSSTLLEDACAAAECLQAETCTISSSISAYWDVEFPGIGDVAYDESTGCILGLTGYDGYYQINNNGIWTVVQIVNSVIVDIPICATTTTTTTVKDNCSIYTWSSTGDNISDLEYYNCNNIFTRIESIDIINNSGAICVYPNTTPVWNPTPSSSVNDISPTGINCTIPG